jgi:hypothetical protein
MAEKAIIHLKPVKVDLKGITGEEFNDFSTHEKFSFVEEVFDRGGIEIEKVEIITKTK